MMSNKKEDDAVREVLERVMPKDARPLSLRMQQWIARSMIACVILYGLLFLGGATLLLLIFGGINYFLTGQPLF